MIFARAVETKIISTSKIDHDLYHLTLSLYVLGLFIPCYSLQLLRSQNVYTHRTIEFVKDHIIEEQQCGYDSQF